MKDRWAKLRLDMIGQETFRGSLSSKADFEGNSSSATCKPATTTSNVIDTSYDIIQNPKSKVTLDFGDFATSYNLTCPDLERARKIALSLYHSHVSDSLEKKHTLTPPFFHHFIRIAKFSDKRIKQTK
ncbi:uncharacterized protein RSE6_09759 [Rhynchosporium secalis]|uniref:Uncharacterized protein n=1 Tax=Rhynchosporium secalis TaxID=38038 RepID=A0A1E1MIT5_RHYSE|nr:uncharacterized protein RSE6_09759 [Rhynchosporium secalis]